MNDKIESAAIALCEFRAKRPVSQKAWNGLPEDVREHCRAMARIVAAKLLEGVQ
jgi:hypothetical protein